MTDQPETFAFDTENKALADMHVAKYPEGRQASAVLPLLDIAQRQCGGFAHGRCCRGGVNWSH